MLHEFTVTIIIVIIIIIIVVVVFIITTTSSTYHPISAADCMAGRRIKSYAGQIQCLA